MSYDWIEREIRRHGARGSTDPRLDPGYVLSTGDLLQHGQVGPNRRSRDYFPTDVNPRPRAKGRKGATTGTVRGRSSSTMTPDQPPKKTKVDISPIDKKMGRQTPAPTPSSDPVASNFPGTGGDPYSNLQAKSQGSMGTDGDEVPVMPHGRVSKIHPDYFTINLPHVKRFSGLGVSALTFAHDQPVFTIRLNSIYDPFKKQREGLGTGLADPFQQDDVQPQGRDIWASHFKYYRVLGAQVKVTIISNCPMQGTTVDPFVNNFLVGYELTDEDQPISNNAEMFLLTKNAKRKILKASPAISWYDSGVPAAKERSTAYSTETFVYNYNPEAWSYHVEEKGSEERWTPIGANPSIDHEYHCRVMHLSDTATPDGRLSILVSINYLVQFREPTDSFFKTRSTATATYVDAEGNPDD